MKNRTSGIESNRASTSAASTASGLGFTGQWVRGMGRGRDILFEWGAGPVPRNAPAGAGRHGWPPAPVAMAVSACALFWIYAGCRFPWSTLTIFLFSAAAGGGWRRDRGAGRQVRRRRCAVEAAPAAGPDGRPVQGAFRRAGGGDVAGGRPRLAGGQRLRAGVRTAAQRRGGAGAARALGRRGAGGGDRHRAARGGSRPRAPDRIQRPS